MCNYTHIPLLTLISKMKIDRKNNSLKIGKRKFDIEFSGNFYHYHTDIKELSSLNIKSQDILQDLIIRISSPDGFGTYLFHEVEFFKNDDDTTQIIFI